MAEEEDSGEKPFEATQRKLDEARRKGEVPISQDLITASTFLGVLLAFALFGSISADRGGTVLQRFLSEPDRLAGQVFSGNGRQALQSTALWIAAVAAMWLAPPTVTAMLGAVIQRALVFAPTKLKPKLSRISPLSNAKQKFGPDGLFNFAKSFAKLAIYAVALAALGWWHLDDILISARMPLPSALALLATLIWQVLLVTFVIMLVLSLADYLWQRSRFLGRQRMSLKEMRDESKETEGDPHTKQARRQKGYDIATTRMLNDVPSADVIVVNPTHYAVALKWQRTAGTAPVCVAKGADEIAARIRETAMEHGVPIFRDAATARALFATLDIGMEIQTQHYRAIAAAIRFADEMRKKAKGGFR